VERRTTRYPGRAIHASTVGNLHPGHEHHAQAHGRGNEVRLVESKSWDAGDGDEVTRGSQRPLEERRSSFEKTRSKNMKKGHQHW